MLWIQHQLMEDIVENDPKTKWNVDNFDGVLSWNGSIDGVTKDEIS